MVMGCGRMCKVVCRYDGVPGPMCTSGSTGVGGFRGACGHMCIGSARVPGHTCVYGPNVFSWVGMEGGGCSVPRTSVHMPRGVHLLVCLSVTARPG